MVTEENKLKHSLCFIAVALTLILYMVNAGENGTFGQSPTVPLPSISKLPAVKLISTGNGENVTVGIPLSVSGVSSDDGVTNCLISLIINDIKPYQQVSAAGPDWQ